MGANEMLGSFSTTRIKEISNVGWGNGRQQEDKVEEKTLRVLQVIKVFSFGIFKSNIWRMISCYLENEVLAKSSFSDFNLLFYSIED